MLLLLSQIFITITLKCIDMIRFGWKHMDEAPSCNGSSTKKITCGFAGQMKSTVQAFRSFPAALWKSDSLFPYNLISIPYNPCFHRFFWVVSPRKYGNKNSNDSYLNCQNTRYTQLRAPNSNFLLFEWRDVTYHNGFCKPCFNNAPCREDIGITTSYWSTKLS